jgi:hypothetical protein
MVKKKSVKKKKTVTKKSKAIPKITSPKVLEKKKLKTAKLLITSGIIFLISIVLYFATTGTLESFFGFIAIFAGAIVLLGITIEVILFLLNISRNK